MKHLVYRSKVNNRLQKGVVYFHFFGTGHQELVFSSHEKAKQFAVNEKIEYFGPRHLRTGFC